MKRPSREALDQEIAGRMRAASVRIGGGSGAGPDPFRGCGPGYHGPDCPGPHLCWRAVPTVELDATADKWLMDFRWEWDAEGKPWLAHPEAAGPDRERMIREGLLDVSGQGELFGGGEGEG